MKIYQINYFRLCILGLNVLLGYNWILLFSLFSRCPMHGFVCNYISRLVFFVLICRDVFVFFSAKIFHCKSDKLNKIPQRNLWKWNIYYWTYTHRISQLFNSFFPPFRRLLLLSLIFYKNETLWLLLWCVLYVFFLIFQYMRSLFTEALYKEEKREETKIEFQSKR